jgi:hypothetical protein
MSTPTRRSRTLLAAVVVLGAGSAACISVRVDDSGDDVEGSGDIAVETRTLGEFDRIVLAGEGNAELDAGTDGVIEIETDDNLFDHIQTTVSGNTLTISTEADVDIDPTDGVIYRLGCPELTSARLTGAGSIDLATCVTTDRLELEVAGAGSILATDLALSALEASLPGAGSIRTTGRADRLDVVVTGIGDFEGENLQTVDAVVRSTGVGNTTVWVTGTLDMELTGVGGIGYYGEPRVSQRIAGVGTVESLGTK